SHQLGSPGGPGVSGRAAPHPAAHVPADASPDAGRTAHAAGPTSPLRAVPAPRHLPEAAALRGAEYHHGRRVRGPGLALPRDRRAAAGRGRERQPGRGDLRQHRLREDRHRVPARGSQLPRDAHAADRLGQPPRLPK
ncbi:hypothetical protein FKM82_017242, partial [Ascaphus truei]